VQSILELRACLGEIRSGILEYPNHVDSERLRPGLEVGAAGLVALRQLLLPSLLFINPTLARALEVLPETFWGHIITLPLPFGWP